MNKIYTSASKIVFLIVTITTCAAFLVEVVRGQVTLDAKDFEALVLVAFTYYFTKPAEVSVTDKGTAVAPATKILG